MIKPTVGRSLWYRPGVHDFGVMAQGPDKQPLVAFVTYVHSDVSINVAIFDAIGRPHKRDSVYLLQEGAAPVGADVAHAEWMPYQKSVAKGETPANIHAGDRPAMMFNESFGIGEAVKEMRDGKRVRRAGWNGKGMWLGLQTPDEHSKMGLPYVYMSTVDGKLVPWLASQTDLLATDWERA